MVTNEQIFELLKTMSDWAKGEFWAIFVIILPLTILNTFVSIFSMILIWRSRKPKA